MGYVRKRDSGENYENGLETNGIIVLFGAFEGMYGKGIPLQTTKTTKTKVLDGTRRLARIPERTKNEGKQVGWQTNRLKFYAVFFNFLDQFLLLSKKQSCRISRIYKSSRSPHLLKPINSANITSKMVYN